MILVLSTYRTGSTNLCKQLSKQYAYENLDECFHESIPDVHKNAVRYISKNKNCVVKLFPYHIEKSPIENLLQELILYAEKVIVLVRKDFDQQCQSYYVCKQTGNWHDNFDQPIDITLDSSKWLWCVNFLHDQYLELSDMINNIDNELMFTHQLNQSKKYDRPVIWDRKPGFTNIDIEELFC